MRFKIAAGLTKKLHFVHPERSRGMNQLAKKQHASIPLSMKIFLTFWTAPMLTVRRYASSLSLAAVVVIMMCAPAAAHEINTSYSITEIQSKQITFKLRVDESDLEKIFDLDENGDQAVTNDEILVNLDDLQAYFSNKVEMIVAGATLALKTVGGSVYRDEIGNTFVDLDYETEVPSSFWKMTLRIDLFSDLGPRHKHLAKIIAGDDLQQAIFTIADSEQSFTIAGRVSIFHQIAQFVWLGMEHIFIGYDHILFLIGLIVLGGSFRNLVKIVTSFTAAHSLTLILAALQIVIMPTRLVESVIALSIVYIAVENFLVKDTDQRWLITFIFGLMHGFGFANVLTELGLPAKGLVASLLAFNIGVEIGQVIIVAAAFPVILLVTRTRWQKQVVYGLSSIILIFGLVWFLERAFGLNFSLV
jgi:hydrogenase/urease accessory protein HupE